jgi:hypothetical protein
MTNRIKDYAEKYDDKENAFCSGIIHGIFGTFGVFATISIIDIILELLQ